MVRRRIGVQLRWIPAVMGMKAAATMTMTALSPMLAVMLLATAVSLAGTESLACDHDARAEAHTALGMAHDAMARRRGGCNEAWVGWGPPSVAAAIACPPNTFIVNSPSSCVACPAGTDTQGVSNCTSIAACQRTSSRQAAAARQFSPARAHPGILAACSREATRPEGSSARAGAVSIAVCAAGQYTTGNGDSCTGTVTLTGDGPAGPAGTRAQANTSQAASPWACA